MAVKLLSRGRLPRTLRGRLIAGLVALLAVGCASVGLVTYFAVHGALSGELNGELRTATGLAYNCWEQQFNGDGNGDNGDGMNGGNGQQGATDPDAAPSASPSASPSSGSNGGGMPFSGSIYESCPGLAEGTFVAVMSGGHWQSALVGEKAFTLTADEQDQLSGISPWQAPSLSRECTHAGPPNADFPTSPRYISQAQGTFLITSILDPDCDSPSTYTGLPLSALHDQLRDVAIAEVRCSAVVVLLAGVLGTFWVRFSLRPLRRVATTASQVAELPLESGDVVMPAGVPDTDPNTETGQVGLAFNRMLGHVETALRRRAASESRLRRFAADASHELRTPLAAIRGYAELALRHPGESPEAVTHALGRVLSESTRMSVLVDDLLLLARLDAGRPLSSEPVDMTRLAIDATSDAQVARPGHRWVLELPDDPELVLGDEHRLRQVLGNLLSNAGRHTPDGTTVTVRVSGALPDGEPGNGPRSASHGNAAARAPARDLGDRRRPRHPRRAAARPVRAVHQGRQRPARTPPTPHRPGSASRSSTPWSPPTTARCWSPASPA